MRIAVPVSAFPLVKQIFTFGAEDAPIDVVGASTGINAAQSVGEQVVIDFASPADHGAFVACLIVGGQDNAAIDEATWDSVFVPIIRHKAAVPTWKD